MAILYNYVHHNNTKYQRTHKHDTPHCYYMSILPEPILIKYSYKLIIGHYRKIIQDLF
jgi:hypothetical protein